MRAILIALVAAAGIGFMSTSASAAGPGKRCGPIPGGGCAAGLWCENPAGKCKRIGVIGHCAKVPKACLSQIVRPVCGCNGKTYANDCLRQMAKVQKSHNGRCKT